MAFHCCPGSLTSLRRVQSAPSGEVKNVNDSLGIEPKATTTVRPPELNTVCAFSTVGCAVHVSPLAEEKTCHPAATQRVPVHARLLICVGAPAISVQVMPSDDPAIPD